MEKFYISSVATQSLLQYSSLIFFHDAFPHYFQWFHPNSHHVCKTAWIPISLRPVLFAKQSAGAALSHYQLYCLNYCACSATSEHCYWRRHQGSLLCCSLRLCLGLDPTKICCQYPSWQTLACSNAFIRQGGFSNAEARVHGRAFCHNTQMLFPLRGHNHWKTQHKPLVRILCVSVGGTEFKIIESFGLEKTFEDTQPNH